MALTPAFGPMTTTRLTITEAVAIDRRAATVYHPDHGPSTMWQCGCAIGTACGLFRAERLAGPWPRVAMPADDGVVALGPGYGKLQPSIASHSDATRSELACGCGHSEGQPKPGDTAGVVIRMSAEHTRACSFVDSPTPG
jgi:hypothetical protein